MTMRIAPIWIGVAAMLGLLSPMGCSGGGAGDELPRESVTGKVTVEGKPLASGTIQFQPASQAEGLAAGGTITDGEFSVPRAEGPVPGKYTVAIYSERESATSSAEETAPAAVRPRSRGEMAQLKGPIPPRYNLQTELTAEVKAGSPNSFSFDLLLSK